MLRYLWIAIILLCTFTTAFAQDDSPAWEITQNCMGELPYPAIPQSEWTFEGVIFTQDSQGVHALRTDMDTPYFVAFDGAGSFSSVGRFSPNGRWFTYPTGSTHFNTNMVGDSFFTIDALETVSTNPQHETLQLQWDVEGRIGSRPENVLPSVRWIDNEHFLYEQRSESGGAIINPFTRETVPWSESIDLYYFASFSPDFTRAFVWDGERFNSERNLYDMENDSTIGASEGIALWMPDSSGYLSLSGGEPDLRQLTLFDRDGQPVETLMTDINSFRGAFSPDSKKLMLTIDHEFYLADMENHVITNLCFEMPYIPFFTWSPDNMSVLFLYDNYPILLNTETLEMQIFRYETNAILGWYTLEE